jgi:hypothetical protein
MLRNIDGGPPGGGRAGGPGAPTINAKKRRLAGPRKVLEMEVRERPSLTLRNIDGRPPRGAGNRSGSGHH